MNSREINDKRTIVDFIDEAIQHHDNDEALASIGEKVEEMMSSRRLFVM